MSLLLVVPFNFQSKQIKEKLAQTSGENSMFYIYFMIQGSLLKQTDWDEKTEHGVSFLGSRCFSTSLPEIFWAC